MAMKSASTSRFPRPVQPANLAELCPPRPETAAPFEPGAYPPAARPYLEAARMAYDYMTSQPVMCTRAGSWTGVWAASPSARRAAGIVADAVAAS